MIYFKLNVLQKDKYTDMGMVNISASFYLEKGDEGWEKYQKEHHIIAPIFPPEGYSGKVDETGRPLDQDDYDKWVTSLPTEERDNAYYNHSIQFDADYLNANDGYSAEEKILYFCELALALSYKNYIETGNPTFKNEDIGYSARRAFYIGVKQIPVSSQTAYEKVELTKCVTADTKVEALKNVDFTTVETTTSYSVRK